MTPGNWNELLRVAAEDGLSPSAMPAYMLIGADADTLARLASGLSPSAHPAGTAANGMAFLAAPDALFVTVPLSGAGDREACLPSARWLSTRPDAPLNGIIWLFSAADAWAARTGDGIAAPYWKLSLAACRRCGVDLPVYALAIGGDGIPGFAEFAASLREEETQAGVIGWAAGTAADAARGDSDWDDPAPGADAAGECLRRWRDYRLSRADAAPAEFDRDAAFLLPWRAGRVVSRLAELIADAAPSRRDASGATLRGVYIVALPGASAPEGGAASDPAASAVSAAGSIPESVSAPRVEPARAAFLRGVFRERILPERWLASEPAERARRRARWTKRFAVLAALLLIAAVAARLTIDHGLRSVTDAPAAVLADVAAYRRWLRGGASGEAPVLAGMDPPPPVAPGSGAPVLPELPLLYQKMIAPCLPILNNPAWLWRVLFRIGPREASDGAGLAAWLSGSPMLALADEQIAAPLALALDRLSRRDGAGGGMTPEEFNTRHGADSAPVDWETAGGERAAVFLDEDEWRENTEAFLVWIRGRQGLLAGGTEFAGLPDRFARKRLLDSYRGVAGAAEEIYRPWPADAALAGYFASSPDVTADALWRDMSAHGVRDGGAWRSEELALVAEWLVRPPAAPTPAALAADWLRAAETWRDTPASPLFAAARTIWRRAAAAGLVKWMAVLPAGESELRAAADSFAPPSAPLPRIPLCALSQASFDPVWGFRPEIWRSGDVARTVSTLAEAPKALADLEAAGLLDSGAAAYLSRLFLEPARVALLAHARDYCDYWVTDIAMLANPAHWIIGDRFEAEPYWTGGAESADDPGGEIFDRGDYDVSSMSWADFQAAAARVDPRDLTRRMLAELTQRRIEALSAMNVVTAVLEGGDGLRTRVEYALAAMAEDAKLFATPEYWQTAVAAWRSWRGLGNDANRALVRMKRFLEKPSPDKPGLMATFFPVLAANYYAPETGEPARLDYWRGFVRTAVELLQAETRRERRLGQRRLLLKADGFPWRRDASGGGTPATRDEMRGLLDTVGFSRIPQTAAGDSAAGAADAAGQSAAEFPDDPVLQKALRELMGGLGLGGAWLPPANYALNSGLLRLLSAFDALEEWENEGGVPLIVLPGRMQQDPRHRFLRAFALRQESRPAPGGAVSAPATRFAAREWERAYETTAARWAWRIPEQEHMRLRTGGAAVFDFYNQTVPVPEARIGQARIGDDPWPVLGLLLGGEAGARPSAGARVEGADDAARVWQARIPVRSINNGGGAAETIWWEFGFALPSVFGPETPGGATILDEWPTHAEWIEAVAEWNDFVGDDPALRIAMAGERWILRNTQRFEAETRVPEFAPEPEAEEYVGEEYIDDYIPEEMLHETLR